jgi:hypothetical protein
MPSRPSFSVALSDRFLRPGISPAPRPVEYGLSSTRLTTSRDRPTGLRQLDDTRSPKRRQSRHRGLKDGRAWSEAGHPIIVLRGASVNSCKIGAKPAF